MINHLSHTWLLKFWTDISPVYSAGPSITFIGVFMNLCKTAKLSSSSFDKAFKIWRGKKKSYMCYLIWNWRHQIKCKNHCWRHIRHTRQYLHGNVDNIILEWRLPIYIHNEIFRLPTNYKQIIGKGIIENILLKNYLESLPDFFITSLKISWFNWIRGWGHERQKEEDRWRGIQHSY